VKKTVCATYTPVRLAPGEQIGQIIHKLT